MAVDIVVPSVGESISEGVLARWLKQDGDAVTEGEPVFELETDKATGEVPAPATGVLHTGASEGQLVKVGAVVGSVDEKAAAPEKKEKPKPSGGRKSPGDEKARVEPSPGDSRPPRAEKTLSPAARRLAEEESVDPAKVKGTGRDGRIIKEDIQAQVAAPAKPQADPMKPQAAPAERETRKRMSSIRQRIADRLVQSQQTTATLTTFNEADMSAVIALRDKHKERFQEKHGVKLGFMGFFVKAAVEALRSFPIVNSRIDGADIVTCHYYDIGVAVSTERGLFVPVVRDADKLSLAHIEKRLGALAVKARDGKIALEDLQGGTFTITNGGVFGSLLSTPLLNPPQSAILGMHTIQKRPVAVDDAVVVRPMMYLALSYDHRLIDGREAVQFLIRVKECIEAPERLLLEV